MWKPKSLRLRVLGLLVVSLVAYAVAASVATSAILERCAEEGALSKVKADLNLAEAFIDSLYPGPWEKKGDKLYKGNVLMNNNHVVNRITALTGDTCTIFLEDVRIATTVPGPSGKPAVGTKLSPEVAQVVLNEGKDYYGPAIVVGKPYQTAYRPLRNSKGEIVGILYVGTPQAQIRSMVYRLLTSKALLLAGLLVVLGTITTVTFARWFSPLEEISQALRAVARGDYSQPLAPSRYTEFEGIIDAVERMRCDIKQTFNRLNDLSNFGMRAAALVMEPEAIELLVHYLKRLRVDEVIVVLIDEKSGKGQVVATYSSATGRTEYFGEQCPHHPTPALNEVNLCYVVRILAPYCVDDVNEELGCRYACSVNPEVKSYVCYPMAVGGRTLGWVRVGSRQPHFFDAETKRSIEGYVSITAAMISNLRLSELNRRLSLIDPLTQLYNRRFLEEYLAHLVVEAQRLNRPFSILFVDVDQFKNVNDFYGHEVGDIALTLLAQTIKQTLRDNDIVVRYGGEEFIAILPGTDLEGAAQAAEKVRRAVAETPICLESGENIFLTVSIGVAQYRIGLNPEEVIQRADEAMYQAKLKGKNLVVAYHEGENRFIVKTPKDTNDTPLSPH
ncbi:diguanylate cyclase [Ammonifex thiophilus]|uniref:Diguanylate cyclase n=1 Tax=Ammonifex thiophilus TaxID=444093 RepID=A0A3D8P4B9_9THEO|nr:diguanylate cyclase [Ammonifex thiophilus]RDV83953.1 diguanylate cyclase [Ammonifex thiophilus]